MAGVELDLLDIRQYGDGVTLGETDEEMAAILNPNIPWSRKRLWQAKSNGCFEPDKYLKDVAKRNKGFTDPEEIARLAFIGYSRQNMVYSLMCDMASKKEDKTLFVDMTKTSYPRPADLKFEKKHVPESFAMEGGTASGLARDPAFFVAERIARILGYSTTQARVQGMFTRALDTLESVVNTSSTMDEVHQKFMEAVSIRKG